MMSACRACSHTYGMRAHLSAQVSCEWRAAKYVTGWDHHPGQQAQVGSSGDSFMTTSETCQDKAQGWQTHFFRQRETTVRRQPLCLRAAPTWVLHAKGMQRSSCSSPACTLQLQTRT